jgi:hypothetical protein
VAALGRYRVILIDVHGSRCGVINPTPSIETLVWDQEAKVWRSFQPETKQ